MATSGASRSIPATVAANIRAARTAKRLTQRQLADLVGIDQMAISRWECATHRPSVENFMALADVLGREVAWFYTDHDQKKAA